MQPIRNSARAVIIREGKILLIEMRDGENTFYLIPGGGQEPGETLHETIVRECREELGAEVAPGAFLFLREYIGSHHEFAHKHADCHSIDLFFSCTLLTGPDSAAATHLDDGQSGLVWVPLRELPQTNLYPKCLRGSFDASGAPICGCYLGDVN